MAAKGRKRKPGKRTKSGQLSRAGTRHRFDKGCDGVQRRREAFGALGHETYDAIGRAYAAGLLGSEDVARDRMTLARRMFRNYWAVYGALKFNGTPMARYLPQFGGVEDPVGDRIREDMLNGALDDVKRAGRDVYSAFSQLVLEFNFDEGPLWLDRLIAGDRAIEDQRRMEKAVVGLDRIG